MPIEKLTDMNWHEEEKKKPAARPAPPKPAEDPAKNRRRHTRFQVPNSSIVLRKAGLLSSLGLGNKGRTVADLSQSGARIRVSERLAPGDKVRMKITLEKYQDEIEISGVVRWCHGTRKGDEFVVGIQFATDDDAANRKLNRVHEWFTSHQYRTIRSGR